ncbi:MAG: hypothetical protein WDA16_00305 [Candidatus Thermoplasmatota archaeon]
MSRLQRAPRRSLRERLYPKPIDKIGANEIPPSVDPAPSLLDEVSEAARERGKDFHASVARILDHVPSVDASTVRRCARDIIRFHDPKTGRDIMLPIRCGGYYCIRCPDTAHHARTLYHARKIASLDSSEAEPLPKVLNLVFTLPPELHAWAREDPRVLPGMRRAILRTLGQAYGYEGRAGLPVDRAAFRELGAIMNLHAIGDEAAPWPKWAPHYDIIIPAWKRADDYMEPLRATWPERYSKTNTRYQDNLRYCLKPLALRPVRRPIIASFLEKVFMTDWHASRPPRTPTNPTGRGVIHQESALHRIRYSCRPLFNMANAHLLEGDETTLVYTVQGRRTQVDHQVPLGPALGQLESIRAWMTGRMTRSWAGILSRTSYDAAARLAGHTPVREREKKGFVHKATYEWNHDGTYQATRRQVVAQADGESDAT